jgi:ADP-heptose:LPS heptosyltransferase
MEKSQFKILVIRFSSFGDIVLSFPLLKKLKEKYPGCIVSYLTKYEYKDLLEINPDVDEIILYENEPVKSLRKKLNEKKFDLVLDIHKNFRSIGVTRNYRNKTRRYFKNNFKKFMLVSMKKNLFKEIVPVYKKYLLTIKDRLNEFDYEFLITGLNFDRTVKYGQPYVVISPSAKHFTKIYPKEKILEAIKKNPLKKIILVGDNSDGDIEICNFIQSQSDNVMNLCGRLNYIELANVIHNSEYVISNDSGVLHFSEALGKRVIALFGSTVKEFGFFPQLKESRVIENNELSCRPCSHIGRSACPLKHFLCMNELKLEIE